MPLIFRTRASGYPLPLPPCYVSLEDEDDEQDQDEDRRSDADVHTSPLSRLTHTCPPISGRETFRPPQSRRRTGAYTRDASMNSYLAQPPNPRGSRALQSVHARWTNDLTAVHSAPTSTPPQRPSSDARDRKSRVALVALLVGVVVVEAAWVFLLVAIPLSLIL